MADDAVIGDSLGTLPIKEFEDQFQAMHKCFTLCEEDVGGCCNVIFGKNSFDNRMRNTEVLVDIFVC